MKKLTHTHFTQQLELMRTERSNLYPTWQELSDYHLSHRGRFLKGEQKDLARKPVRQVNNTSRLAARTTASGMMAGITSPGRPWFRLQAPDPDLNEVTAVKQWLHEVMVVMNRVFSQSNTYNSLHTLYGELATFGTGAMGVYPDFDNVIRCKTHTIGSYFLGMGGHNEVNQFYREYTMSVGEVVQRFGIDNVRESTKQLWKSNNLTAQIRIIHCIEPNDDRNMISPLASDKAYRSVYFEQDTSSTQTQSSARGNSLDETDKYLLRSGFDIFPELTPRWEVTGEDVYGSDCPGMTCLGDTKSLQLLERRKFQAIQKVAASPLQGDAEIINRIKDSGLEPDEHIAVSKDQKPLEAVYANYRPDINQIRQEIDQTENRISRAYYEDLFLMLSNSNRRQITATEVAERQEEKLLMLGPVLQRLHHELLDPLIDITFSRLQGAGVLPPPPPELDNVELGVEYVSVLAQAQRLVAVGGIERLTGFVASAAQLDPSARHKIDLSQSIDEYSLALGVNPRIVRGDNDVAKIVQGEQQAAQAQATLEQASQAAALAEQGQNIETGDDSNVTKDLLESAGLG